ncbi:MAG: putative toxin-antitoxin system toxin component, PIN family [Candidatus Brocadiales bacterium]|nr:putative toxin-antitoxin system toxin component, PIN family [Candidatus Brocadiales bacterium]
MTVVLDSNIVYAGLYSNKGASHQILKSIGSGKLVPILTVSLYEEYSDILRRSPLADVVTEDETQRFLDFFCKSAILQDIFFLWRPFLKDPKDDLVLEAAVASQSKIIITHNIRDFNGIEKFGIEAMLPGEYLRKESKT